MSQAGAPPIRSPALLWPVRLILVGIVFAMVLPGVVFCGVLMDRLANSERSRTVEMARAAALRAAETLDREIDNLNAALLALSTSAVLDDADLSSFHAQASLVANALGQSLVLAAPDGRELMSTRRPPDTALPFVSDPATLRSVVQSGQPGVSRLFTGAVSGVPAVAVEHPVLRDGRVVAVLMISLEPAFLSKLLAQQSLPHGWLAAVADQDLRIVARTSEPERFLGHSVAPDVIEHASLDSDTWVGTTLEGLQVLAASQHLKRAGWLVTVGAPLSLVEAPLWSTLGLIAVAGLAAMGAALLLAVALGRSLTRPLARLARSGPVIAQGLAVEGVRTRIAEVDAVSRALVSATRDLRARADALAAERTAALEAANRRLREEAAAREAAEDRMRQAQKMEAVGQLTGGIAHDFNNLLTIVIGSLDLLRRRAADDRARRLTDNALDGASRAATLTARLLAFSRRQPLTPGEVDVNKLVAGMSDLLRRTLGEGVQVETVLAGGLWQTHADANQLENALLNLAVNGRDAIVSAGRPGGRLVIETANAVLDAGFCASEPGLLPGDYVQIAVVDNGTGMPSDVVPHVFEPFFTTKPQGQGTGLGLSQVHGFVKQSGGHVAIRTVPGEGTAVTIYMPRFAADLAGPALAGAAEPAEERMVVLVVEDDAGVRRTSAEALRELGHVVLEADAPGAALRLLDAHPEVSLLITDVRLPEMDGPALAARVRDRRPDLPVLFVSGFTGAAISTPGPLLQKPFTLAGLAAAVRDAANAVRPAGLEPATKPL